MAKMLYQGHGSYRFTRNDGTVIYFDPFAGEGYDLPADLILVTHEHFDHNQVDKMPHAEGCEVLRVADFQPTPGDYRSFESHGVKIRPVKACNKNHPIEKCVGLVLEFDGVKFYGSGDTSTTDDMRRGTLAKMKLDYAAFPCDGFYNMGTKEASKCARLVAAKHSIPIHLVPMDDPSDPAQLFDRKRAETFKAEGRIIIGLGEEIEL